MSKQELQETIEKSTSKTAADESSFEEEEHEDITADEQVLQDFYKKEAQIKQATKPKEEKPVAASTYEDQGEGAHMIEMPLDKTKLSKTDIRSLHKDEVKQARKELDKLPKPQTFPNHAEISFFGASGTVTGSKHMITYGSLNALIDCGMYQGLKELRYVF